MATGITSFILGFLVGSVPVAWILVRLSRRRDVSLRGSRNVGALNALRVSRSKAVGITVMLLDQLKGACAVWLAWRWHGFDLWAAWSVEGMPEFIAFACGTLGAIAGHNYNPWLSIAQRKLVGGKGFAAAAGGLLLMRPWLVVTWLLTGVVAWFVFKRARGIVDEAPASAVATLSAIGWGYAIYDGPTALLGAGVSLLCIPKIVPELITLFGSAPAEPPAEVG